jgi:hypothetical protein
VAVAESECLWDEAVLVYGGGTRACFEEDADDVEVAIGSSKVKWGGCLCSRAGGSLCLEARRVDVCAVEDEHTDALLASAGASGMEGEDAVEVAVGWLAIFEGELD